MEITSTDAVSPDAGTPPASRRLDRRALARLLGASAGAAGLAAVGCGPQAQPGSPTAAPSTGGATPAAGATAATGAAAAGTPKRGGTAVIAIDSDPDTLNLALTTGYSSGDVASKIFEGLTRLDNKFEPQPALATSWTVAPDGKTYTFKLRPGVKWHDGKDLTATDVKFTFEEVLAKFHPRTSATLRRMDGIDTPDPQTVVLRLKEAYAPLLLQLTAFDAPIIPAHVYGSGDVTKHEANQRPVGTGPFKFSEWNRGASLKVVRNETYWEAPRPYLDAIIFQVVPQGPNRSTGLETGEIDFVVDFYLAKADVGRLSTNAKLQSRRGQGTPAINFIMTNTRTAALAKKEARQALAYAINRKTLVDQAMGGLGRQGVGAFGDGFKWLVNEDVSFAKKYPNDVQKAKDLLTAAGVAQNTTLRLVYDAARPQFVAGAQIVRDNLRQVGLNVDLQPLERSVMIQKVFSDKEYDLTFQSYSSSGDPSIGYHRMYVTTDSKAQFTNASGYSNPKVDELLDKAAVAPNQAERARLYKEAQVILNDDLPSIVLFDEEGIDFATKKLSGVWTSVESRDRWGDVWISG